MRKLNINPLSLGNRVDIVTHRFDFTRRFTPPLFSMPLYECLFIVDDYLKEEDDST
jgi:hypothetical protein